MKLLTLQINNFKAIRDFTLDADGRGLSIFAENGVGKTTVADAFYWLLFGKDSIGRKDYEIKTVGEDGEAIHFLDHEVAGAFEMSDGEILTLTRTYKESWETQRGQSAKSFKGHETSFTVNSVPQSATEYQRRIAAICDESQFRLLTDPSAFLSLTWQDRRKMLFDTCGDIKDADVIASTSELADLGKLLGSYSVDDFKKVEKDKRDRVRDERTAIPARIDEATRAIPSADKTNWEAELTKRTAALTKLQEDRASLTAGGKVSDLRSRLTVIDAERRSIAADLRSKPNPAREAAIQARSEASERLRSAADHVEDLFRRGSNLERQITAMDQELEIKRAEALAEKGRIYSGAAECPSCNRPLPEDQVSGAVEEFNAARAKCLDAMVTAGKALAAERDKLAAQLTATQEELVKARQSDASIRAEIEAIEIPVAVAADPSTDPGYIALTQEDAAVTKELTALLQDSAKASMEIDEKVHAAQELVAEAQAGIANAKQRADGLVRVETLKAREKELATQFEALERSLYLCEQFVRAKVRMLTDRINNRFRLTTFRLFKEQINGGITECCDVLWRENGAQPSNGQAVQIGLDIIATLSAHIGFAPCIFIDNAESVTTLPETQGQQIHLVVSAGDRSMRIVRDATQIVTASAMNGASPITIAEDSKEPALF